ncbi:hypothetical protein TTSV1_gp32 [Thermoproteus tenax spherical virus 1]|uniref:Uncharacterized protein n=1 Tax=Thermoproteus tenax spherical virus 1 TaxID=292639 RepID=Q647D0_9VIRU|nr:hypothetical protein TTSV1_gp32 [Thermoproteus tenax spherical virus 1]AAU25982.1 hypothetical protein [Thermoproteus tenax spherical virus 1]
MERAMREIALAIVKTIEGARGRTVCFRIRGLKRYAEISGVGILLVHEFFKAIEPHAVFTKAGSGKRKIIVCVPREVVEGYLETYRKSGVEGLIQVLWPRK